MRVIVPRLRMIELLVMLPEKVFAVIIAIRRANDCVNVIARRLVVSERNAALVVELDKNHRAVNAIIKAAKVFEQGEWRSIRRPMG